MERSQCHKYFWKYAASLLDGEGDVAYIQPEFSPEEHTIFFQTYFESPQDYNPILNDRLQLQR